MPVRHDPCWFSASTLRTGIVSIKVSIDFPGKDVTLMAAGVSEILIYDTLRQKKVLVL